jgi:beta-glucosidase
MKYLSILLIIICFSFSLKAQLLYKNSTLPVEERLDDLLSRMTLEEKIGQMSMKSLSKLSYNKEEQISKESLEELFKGESIGCLESPFIHVEDIANYSEAADKYLREETRLGIPAIQIAECLHGQIAHGATIFPQSIALGSTWNPDLIKEIGEIIAKEASSTGVDQALSPLFDIARDPRYGRVEECYGEDPVLVAKMGIAFVKGMQGNPQITLKIIPKNHLACTAKHLAGYSVPIAGINLAPSDIGERELRTKHLYPFEKAIKDANIYSVMPSYNEVDGVPAHSSIFLLDQVLRKEWNFSGYVFSDYGGISMLKGMHFTVKDKTEAGIQAVMAGVDLEAPGRWGYSELKKAVEEGKLDPKYIDQAVRNILRVKFKLRLFDNPYKKPDNLSDLIHKKEHIDLALKSAEEAIILLQNMDNLLPLNLNELKSIAVIGPNANQVQFGDYSCTKSNEAGVTILEGIQQFVGNKVKINYAKGCGITELSTSGFAEAEEIAKESDMVVLVIGGTSATLSGIGWENNKNNEPNTCGEGFDITTLTSPGVQSELIKLIHSTGKPIVLITVHGRPYSIKWEKEHIPAILEAWYPGEEGGTAVANILFGKVNPSGRLPVTIPQSVGHVPVTYDYKPSGRGYYKRRGTPEKPGRDYVFSSPEPLFEFGFGLSYTTFEYKDLNINNTYFEAGEPVEISLIVKNVGDRVGKEVVQLYINDLISSVTTSKLVLRDFKKVEIEAGEEKDIVFILTDEDFSLWNINMERVVEPGDFEIMIGASCEDIRLKEILKLKE